MNETEYKLIVIRLNTVWPHKTMPPATAAEWMEPLCRFSAAEVHAAIDSLRMVEDWRPSLAAIVKACRRARHTGPDSSLPGRQLAALPSGPVREAEPDSRIGDLLTRLVKDKKTEEAKSGGRDRNGS